MDFGAARAHTRGMPEPAEQRDFSRLPPTPPPSQWVASQDVRPLDKGPQRLAYNDDADLILRYIGIG